MELSIIMVNYNTGTLLRDCLNSINKNIRGILFEIIVIDNNSQDQSVKIIKEEFKGVKLIENQKNLGFSKANNQGIAQSSGKYLLLLNPDTVITSGNVFSIIQYMEMHRDIGILGTKIFDADGKIQLSCRSFPSFKTALFTRYALFTKLFPKNRLSADYLLSDWDHNAIRQVDWVSGACMLIRKGLLEDIGPLDENFFMYCEDVDICLRAKKSGWKIAYFPDFSVIHHISGSSKGLRFKNIFIHHKSMLIFYKKHFKRNFFLDVAVLSGIIFRACVCMFKDTLLPR